MTSGDSSPTSKVVYTVSPATEEDVLWAAETAKRVYTGLDVIPAELMLEWFAANPTGFSVIRDPQGRRCGNMDILPLKPEALARFLRGELIECDIRGDSLFRPHQAGNIDCLYLESLVALNDGAPGNPRATHACFVNFPRLVRRMCVPRHVRKVYAMGASDGGARLLRGLGFEEMASRPERRDGHRVSSVRLPDMIRNIARRARGQDRLELERFLWELG